MGLICRGSSMVERATYNRLTLVQLKPSVSKYARMVELGIHTGLKILRPKGIEGSTPSSRTN